jgi:hypothetical protein
MANGHFRARTDYVIDGELCRDLYASNSQYLLLSPCSHPLRGSFSLPPPSPWRGTSPSPDHELPRHICAGVPGREDDSRQSAHTTRRSDRRAYCHCSCVLRCCACTPRPLLLSPRRVERAAAAVQQAGRHALVRRPRVQGVDTHHDALSVLLQTAI